MTRMLVIAQADDGIVDWAVGPFRLFTPNLRLELGLKVEVVRSKGLAEVPSLMREHASDLAIVSTSWRESPEDTIETFRAINRVPKRPPVVYLDTFDQTTSPFFGILPHVDLYLKKQIYRDLSAYNRDYQGGYVVADYIARRYDFELRGWKFGSMVPEGFEDRIWLGWNLGTAPFLVKLLLSSLVRAPKRIASREVGVHYRVSYSSDPDDWYTFHRRTLLEALQSFEADETVVAAAGKEARVPPDVFNREMRESRIGVSPFGWGEVTDRDFRIVINSTLLMKPDMSHLRTEPDIYIPGVTYVPFAWDASDLQDKCRYYLDHPKAAERIARAARTAYLDWYRRRRFVGRIQDILEHLSVA